MRVSPPRIYVGHEVLVVALGWALALVVAGAAFLVPATTSSTAHPATT